MSTTATSPSEVKKPLARRLLRLVLILAALTGLAWAAALWAIESKVRSARETAGNDLQRFVDLVPAELPEGTLNASDYLESAVILAEGQQAIGVNRASHLPPEAHAMIERLKTLDSDLAAPAADDLASFRPVVESLALPLEVLDEAWDRGVIDSRYPTNYEGVPAAIVIPNLVARLRLAKVLRVRGLLAASDGRAAEAWQDAVLLYRFADWTTHEVPTLINALIGRAIALQGARLTQALLATAPPDAATRQRLFDEARRSDPRSLFSRAYQFEISGLFLSLQDRRVDQLPLGLRSRGLVERFALTRQPWRRLNAALYLEAAAPAFELCEQPAHALAEDARSQMEALQPPAWATPAKDAFFVCLGASRKRDAWLAQVDQLEIALALEAIRETEGAYPEDLGALGQRFRDPFADAPYHYRKEGEGYRLWSVSGNRRDDGGQPDSGGPGLAELDHGDLVWRVRDATSVGE